MRQYSKIALVIMVISLGFLLSTVNTTIRKQVEIPFSTPSGQAGKVQLSIPTRVYAGDEVEIITRVTLTFGNENTDTSTITGRVEAGFEEINPAGEVRVNVQSGTPVVLNWEIRSARDSTYPGHLWLWLETDHSRELILAREFVLESRYYLGRQVLIFRILFSSILLLSCLTFILCSHPKRQ